MSIFFLVIDLAPYTSEQFRRVPKYRGKYSQPEKHHTGIHHGEGSDNLQVRIKDVRLNSLVGILVSGLASIEKLVQWKNLSPIVFSGAVSSNSRRQSTK